MADPYTFTFDVDAFLSGQEVEKETPPEGVMKRPAKEAEAKSDTPTESLMTRLATALKNTFPDSPALGATPQGDNSSGRNKALTDWTISTEAFIPKYRGDVPAAMALQASPVTTTDMGPDMGTLAMQDAQEQSAIRSVTGITESLGRPQPTAMTDVAGLTAMLEGEADSGVTLPSTDSVSDMYPTQGLMSPPVQDTVLGVDTDTPEAPVEDDTVATYSETTDVEGLEGPEAISSAVVQSLKKQTNTVSRGDKGNTVLNAQLRLAELGYEIGRGGTSGLSKNKQGKWVSLDNSQLRGVDSDFGPSTQSAVKDFQEDAGLPITGEIDAATATALATKEPVAFRVPENLTKNFSTAQTSNFNAAKDAAEKEGLKGAELASFMSQVAHESDSFKTAKEYASGSAYEGRSDLGNTQAGDGVRYKGRGYIQLTGKSNYEKAGKALGLDLLNNPSLAEEPKNAAAVSLWFWKTKVKPQVPDFMDTERVTKVVNGGFNGLKDRKKYFEKFTKKWGDDK